MKISPEDQRIMDRMVPGVLSREGFLGADTRPLSEIIDTDRSAVEALGVTHEQIAGKLRSVLEAAIGGMGRAVEVSDHLTAVWREAMGKIPSPWADGVFPKGEVELTDRRTGEKLLFTPLSVHLIARHGFYQGRGSRYRIDPATISRIFGTEH
jgi:hypothetical protein